MRTIILAALFMCGMTRAHDIKFSYDCDTQNNHFSMFTLELENGSFVFSTNISQLEARNGNEYRPIANIFIGGKESSQAAGVRFAPAQGETNEMEFLLHNESKYGRGQAFGNSTSAGEKVPVELKFNLGKLYIKIANLPVVIEPLGFQPRELRLVCSTGDYEFSKSKLSIVK